jgi:hypothetical protein
MASRNVMPPEELADQIWGPGHVLLDFEDDPIKHDCVVIGTPGMDPVFCFSVWLTEEVGVHGEKDYRLKHFAPGLYTAIFVEMDDVTGRPIFERAVGIVPENSQTSGRSPAKKVALKNATPKPSKKIAPKNPTTANAAEKSAKKPTPKKPSTKKPAPKPSKKASPKKSSRKPGKKDGK